MAINKFKRSRLNFQLRSLILESHQYIKQGFPGRRILRLLLSKTSLGPPKNYHVRPLGLAIICEEVKKEKMITFLRVIPV